MHPTQPNPQMPVVYAVPNTNAGYALNVSVAQSRRAIVNGILQIIVGACCIIVNSIALGLGSGYGWGVIGHGYWAGVFYIVTGSIVIASGKTTTKCMIIASMVLCIISASLITPGHLTAAVIGTVLFGFSVEDTHNHQFDINKAEFGTQLTLSILAVIEFAFAVWGSTIWCKTIGCCNDSQSQMLTPAQYIQMSNGQPIILVQASGGQFVPYNIQPQAYPNYPTPAYQPGLVPVGQAAPLPEKVQPKDNHDNIEPGRVGTYLQFA